MKTLISAAVLSSLLIVTACGDTTSDRALSGGALGAGVGAVGSRVLGGSAVGGALVGGAVGAAAGGLTNKNQVDLGKPVWRR